MEGSNPFEEPPKEKDKKKKKHRSSLSLRSSKDRDSEVATEPLLSDSTEGGKSPLLKGQVEPISSHRRSSNPMPMPMSSTPTLTSPTFGQVRDAFHQALPSATTKPRSPMVSPRVLDEPIGDLNSEKDYTNRVIYTLLARQIESVREEYVQEMDKLGKRLASSLEFLFQRTNLFSYAMSDISRGAVYETTARGDLNPLVAPNPAAAYTGWQARPADQQARPPPNDSCCSCLPWS